MMERLGWEDGEPIEHKFISNAIENSQKKVEGHYFDIRNRFRIQSVTRREVILQTTPDLRRDFKAH